MTDDYPNGLGRLAQTVSDVRRPLSSYVNDGNLWALEGELHLIIDGFGGNPDRLGSEGLVSSFLDEHPGKIAMTKISSPQVYTYRGRIPEDWGVSGFVLIAESHISVHTFPDRGRVNVDIFSCNAFDTGASVKDVKELFLLDSLKVHTMERGPDYSSPEEARNGVIRERSSLAYSAEPADG